MNIPREVAEQALAALEKCRDWPGAYDECSRAVHGLRAALAQPDPEWTADDLRDAVAAEFAQPEPEPVAWGQLGMVNGHTYLRTNYEGHSGYPPPPDVVRNMNLVPLYLHPPAPQPPQADVDWQQKLGNLLARIHRDGGHYIQEHGWKKAIDDADEKIVAWIHGEQTDVAQDADYETHVFEPAEYGSQWCRVCGYNKYNPRHSDDAAMAAGEQHE